jgi:hypothetical protein
LFPTFPLSAQQASLDLRAAAAVLMRRSCGTFIGGFVNHSNPERFVVINISCSMAVTFAITELIAVSSIVKVVMLIHNFTRILKLLLGRMSKTNVAIMPCINDAS